MYRFDLALHLCPARQMLLSPLVLHWTYRACVLTGFGIRGIPENTFFFEKVVEATRRGAPKATLVFNTSPDSTVDAAKRWFKTDG